MHVCVCVCEICKKKIAISIDCDEIYRDIILHYVLYIYAYNNNNNNNNNKRECLLYKHNSTAN